MYRFRPLPVAFLAIAVCALVGGLFGSSVLATDDRVPERYKTFSTALRAIESNYVDNVESDRLVYSAIRGMLSTLDPHSSFFDPQEYARMRERQEGRYYGIGIQITSNDGDIIAATVFEGSPAHKQGIRRSDVTNPTKRTPLSAMLPSASSSSALLARFSPRTISSTGSIGWLEI